MLFIAPDVHVFRFGEKAKASNYIEGNFHD